MSPDPQPPSQQRGITLFGKAFAVLLKNDPLRMAGATAFFTTFALPPILVILFQMLRLFISPQVIRAELSQTLSETLGSQTLHQLVQTLRGLRQLATNWYVAVGGFIFLLFVATTLFKIIKSSVNQIWSVRARADKKVRQGLRTRGQSLLVILVAGLLFVVGLVAEGAQAFIGAQLLSPSPAFSLYFGTVVHHLVSLLIVTLWFALVFRVLPDGKPAWGVALTGALVTAVLFTLGRTLIRLLLGLSNINNLYGTSASIVLLLLFVFYSSLILYYGAAFTKVLGGYWGKPIRPKHYAVHYRTLESDLDDDGEQLTL